MLSTLMKNQRDGGGGGNADTGHVNQTLLLGDIRLTLQSTH